MEPHGACDVDTGPSPDTGQALARDAQFGDHAAYARLVEHHYRAVLGLAYAATGDWAAAEDLAQDTFLAAWQHRKQLRRPAAFAGWIRAIVRNLGRNWRRSQAYRRQLAEAYGARTAHRVQEPADTTAEEHRAELHDALYTVSRPVREAMVLYYFEELPIREIARVLGTTENSVKKRLQRGRHQLRVVLEEQWREDIRAQRRRRDDGTAIKGILAGLAAGATAQASAAIPGVLQQTLVQHPITFLGGNIMSAKSVAAFGAVAVITAALVYFVSRSGPSTPTDRTATQDISTNIRPVDSGGDPPQTTSPDPIEALDQSETPSTGRDPAELVLAATIEEPTYEISGEVLNVAGAPVGGAEVLLAYVGPNPEISPKWDVLARTRAHRDPASYRTAQTRADGAFQFENLESAGIFTVSAVADSGGAMQHVAVRPPKTVYGNIRFVLQEGVIFTGRLLDPTRKPSAGAFVRAIAFAGAGFGMGGVLGLTATDDDGLFSFRFQNEGTAILRAVTAEGLDQTFSDVPVGLEEIVELTMTLPASIEGTAYFADGTPAEGFRVVAYSSATVRSEPQAGRGGGASSGGLHYAVEVDEAGQYRLDTVSAGVPYDLLVQTATGVVVSEKAATGELSPKQTFEWHATVTAVATITGRVTGAQSGKALPGMPVALLRDGASVEKSETDASGDYTIEAAVLPGDYVVSPHYLLSDAAEDAALYGHSLDLRADEPQTVDLVIDDPLTAGVEVVNTGAVPVEAASVIVMKRFDGGGMRGQQLGLTDAEGRYDTRALAPAPAARYTFEIEHPHYARAGGPPFDGRTTASPVEQTIVLYQKAGIEGVAMDADGQPLANVPLWVYRLENGEEFMAAMIQTTDQGYFAVLDQLPARNVAVRISVLGRTPLEDHTPDWESESLSLQRDSVTDLGAVRFPVAPE